MKALVTGGAGFVGRHLVNRLLARGDEVTVVDNLSSGMHPTKWPNCGDMRLLKWVYDDVRNFFKRTHGDDFDVVFHLAAVVGGRLKIEGAPLQVATDLAIDSDLFNWATIRRVKYKPKIVYFSSSAVYPLDFQSIKHHQPLRESLIDFAKLDIGMPDFTYGWAKLTGEYLAKHAVEKYDLDVVIYRPFSGYGEDQSFDYPFPSIVKRVLDGENPALVWGRGRQTRDFIYIEDVIDCVFASMDKMQPGEALNIGSGIPVSFFDLVYAAGEALGHSVGCRFDLEKPEGVFYRVANVDRMYQYYIPKTTLEQGIKHVATTLLTANAA